jgi:excisionase family DNA binding protein
MSNSLCNLNESSKHLLLTIDQTCELLNLKQSKIRSMIFKNEIPVIRLGRCIRFSQKDLEQWLFEKKKYLRTDSI